MNKCNGYIIEHIAVMSKLQPGEIRREDIPEYGKFSIRELITNAVCHRNYEDWGSKEGHITNTDYRKIFPGITDRTVLNDLKDLVTKGVLKRIGKTKGAYYMLRIPK